MSTELEVRYIPHKPTPLWELLEPLEWYGYTIPKGFVTDFASTPRFMWPIFPPADTYTRSAVLHDYLLSINTPWNIADNQFRLAMKEEGTGNFRRWVMWFFVRVWGFYKKIRNRIKAYLQSM